MVAVRADEEVQSLVRVFKWNEKLHEVESSEGLFLVCIKLKPYLTAFDLVKLSDQDSIKELVSDAIESRDDCLDDTTAKLREAVCDYLLGCFAFDIQPSSSPSKPTLVIVVDVDVSKRTEGTRKRHLPFEFSSEREETRYSQDHALTEDTHDNASKSVKNRKVGDARDYKKAIRSRMQQKKLSEREETRDSQDHALTEDNHDDASKSVKNRKVGDARDYKKAIRSRMQQKKSSDREENKLRYMLRCFGIIPVVAGEPKGLSQVKVDFAVKVKEFDGRESEDVCSICLDGISTGMRVAQSPCSHLFHRDCLFRWLPRDCRCPMCRKICATLVES